MVLDKKKNLLQRLEFVRFYAGWVKSMPNEVWSKQQAMLINSMMENAKNFMLSGEVYLESKEKRKGKRFWVRFDKAEETE